MDEPSRSGDNKKPVKFLGAENQEFYSMLYKKKGLCIIFNNKNFDDHKWQYLEQRKGTDIDSQQLKYLFQVKLGFDVQEFKDYTYKEIEETLQTVQNLHESEYSSLVCCILSYGRKNFLCDSNFGYETENIYKGFFGNECKAFAGKPKIFFIQACPCNVDVSSDESTEDEDSIESIFRNSSKSGFEVVDSTMDVSSEESTYYGEKYEGIFTLPTRCDFLVVSSTIPGNLSWNSNSDKGSWFIEDLCSTMEHNMGEMHLLEILGLVSHKLAERHKGKGLAVEVPCVTSTLIRDIEFLVRDSRGSETQRYELVSIGNRKKGKVLIFNHEFYDKNRSNELDPRNGTDNDVKCLMSLFPRSDFKLRLFKDKTKAFIFQELHKAAKSHKRYSCIISCILTHGNNHTLSAFDEDYDISDLLGCFQNKWRGKPKVFLLQACRGNIADPGFEMTESLSMSDSSDSDTDSDFEEIVSGVPVNFRHLTHPDFLVLSSAPPGCLSFRSTSGSWFIKELWKASYGQDKDFLQLFTETNREVAKRVSKNPKKLAINNKKLTLCLTSTLTRNLDFRSLN